MASIEQKNFRSPDETRPFGDKGKVQTVNVGGLSVSLLTGEPGWSWSKHMKPVVGGDSCQTEHRAYIVSGRTHIKHNDGSEAELGPGDVVHVAPGHDGWTVGDEPLVWFEFGAATTGRAR